MRVKNGWDEACGVPAGKRAPGRENGVCWAWEKSDVLII